MIWILVILLVVIVVVILAVKEQKAIGRKMHASLEAEHAMLKRQKSDSATSQLSSSEYAELKKRAHRALTLPKMGFFIAFFLPTMIIFGYLILIYTSSPISRFSEGEIIFFVFFVGFWPGLIAGGLGYYIASKRQRYSLDQFIEILAKERV